MHSYHVQVLNSGDKIELYLVLGDVFKSRRLVINHRSVCSMSPAHQFMLLVQHTGRLVSRDQTILQTPKKDTQYTLSSHLLNLCHNLSASTFITQ